MGTPAPYARWYPVLALRTHGRIGHMWIHKDYRTFRVVTKYYYPENPKTAFQQAWREVFYTANKNWQGFDEDTKIYYTELTRPKAYTGQLRYLSLYLNANYPPVYETYYLLQENGDLLLTEAGDKIMREGLILLLTEAGDYLNTENLERLVITRG